jgi:hypothetical protein
MFQFSIRTLFITTTVFAVILWVLFAPPTWVGALVLVAVFLLLLPLNIAGLIYHRGYWQAFFVGTAPWAALTAWYTLWIIDGRRAPFFPWPGRPDDVLEVKLTLFFALCFIALSGLMAVGVRWWANRAKTASEGPPPPS